MNRRDFLAAAALASYAVTRSSRAQTVPTTAAAPATTRAVDVDWHDARDRGVVGRAFDDTLDYFDRLPGRARGVVRDAASRAGSGGRSSTSASAATARRNSTSAGSSRRSTPARS